MRKTTEIEDVNLTPMIDIVFQMIIFFVTTVDLDKEKFKDTITVPDANSAEAVEEVEPSTVFIQVDKDGHIYLGQLLLPNEDYLRGILKKAMGMHGQGIPVVIHADGNVQHQYVRNVMDIVSGVGLWKINFSATTDKGEK